MLRGFSAFRNVFLVKFAQKLGVYRECKQIISLPLNRISY